MKLELLSHSQGAVVLEELTLTQMVPVKVQVESAMPQMENYWRV